MSESTEIKGTKTMLTLANLAPMLVTLLVINVLFDLAIIVAIVSNVKWADIK